MKDFIEVKESLFECTQTEGLTEEQINEAEQIYNKIDDYLAKGGKLQDLDEGFFSGLVGGAAGAAFGPAIGKAICKALGIERGVLYDLFTSRLVTTAIGVALGK